MMTRRTMLAQAAAATAAAVTGYAPAGAQAKPMRLGGPVFVDSDDPAVLAQAHRRLGYRAAYAPSRLSVNDTTRIAAVIEAYRAQDVVIAEVGAWRNMLDPDAAKRRENIAYVTDRLALAEALGARCCVDIAGSFNAEVWFAPHPDNFSPAFFDATVEAARAVIDAVKPRRTVFTIEMMPWCWPSSPDEYLTLIKAIDRPAFGVHLDVCNLMNSPVRMYNNARVIDECFDKLGRWIASCHAKDVNWGPGYQVNIQEVIPGAGVIDYPTYLRRLSRLPVDAPLMLEHLSNEGEYAKGRTHIERVAKAAGLSFGA